MRTRSLIAQCLPGLVPQDRGSHSTFTMSDRDVHLPSPAVEIIPSKVYELRISSCSAALKLGCSWDHHKNILDPIDFKNLEIEDVIFLCADGSPLQVCRGQCRLARAKCVQGT